MLVKPFEILGIYRRKPIAWDRCSPFFEDSEARIEQDPVLASERGREQLEWWAQVRRDNRLYNVIAWGQDADFADYCWRPGGIFCDRGLVSHTVRERWDEQSLYDLDRLMEEIVNRILNEISTGSLDGGLFDAVPYKWLEGYWFVPLRLLMSSIQDATVDVSPRLRDARKTNQETVTRHTEFKEFMQTVGFADHVSSRP